MKALQCALAAAAWLLFPMQSHSDTLALRGDAAGTTCDLTIAAATIVQVHIFHEGAPGNGGSAAAFAVVLPPCWDDVVWLGDIAFGNGFKVGQSPTGVEITYGACHSLPYHVGYINYMAPTVPDDCCILHLSAHPDYAAPEIATCLFAPVPATGQPIVLNPNETCACNGPVSTSSATWGAVKALYR